MPEKVKKQTKRREFSDIKDIDPKSLEHGADYVIEGLTMRLLDVDQRIYRKTGIKKTTYILGYEGGSKLEKKISKDVVEARPACQELAWSGEGCSVCLFLTKTGGLDIYELAEKNNVDPPSDFWYERSEEFNCIVYKLSAHIRVHIYADGSLYVFNHGELVIERNRGVTHEVKITHECTESCKLKSGYEIPLVVLTTEEPYTPNDASRWPTY